MKFDLLFRDVYNPLDVVIIEKDYEFLSKKCDVIDIPDSLMNDIFSILTMGSHPQRNPTLWALISDRNIEYSSNEFKNLIANFYRLTSKISVSDVDNETNHVKLSAKFVLIADNAKDVKNEIFEESKCITVKTILGDIKVK